MLFELIAERYERKSIGITANTPFSQWGDVFANPAMTLAAIDRLVHHATILEMNVESYRRRAAQETQTHQSRAKNKPTAAVDSVDELHKPDTTAGKGLIHPAHSTAATTISEKKEDEKEGMAPSPESPGRILLPPPKRPG